MGAHKETYTPHTMSTASDIITLTHNQIIRVKGFYRSTSRILVRTPKGYSAETSEPIRAEAEPWTIQETAVLDGRDKSEMRAKIEAAPEIEHGQQVIIEGSCYRVKVNGQQFRDPVDFIFDSTPL